jgi:hypothetical protein
MVYKVSSRLAGLTVLLLVASLFFTYSVYASEMGTGGLVVCLVIVAFIFFNLLVVLTKKIEVSEDGTIAQTTIYGKKSVNVSDIDDIGVVRLRWRVILILSDPHKFVFISSLYEDFEDFVEYLKKSIDGPVENALESVTAKLIKKKRIFLKSMIMAATVFFIGSGVYNILYR